MPNFVLTVFTKKKQLQQINKSNETPSKKRNAQEISSSEIKMQHSTEKLKNEMNFESKKSQSFIQLKKKSGMQSDIETGRFCY